MDLAPLRILCVLENAGAGCGRHVIDIYAGLSARGHRVTILYSHSRLEGWFVDELDAVPAISRATVPMRDGMGFGDIASVRAVRRFIREHGPFDVVHGHSSKGGALARLAANGSESIRVYTPHALYTLGCDDRPVRRRVFAAIERVLARRCEGIICVSEAESRHARSQGLPAGKLFTVPNGLDPLPEVDRGEVRRELGLEETDVAIGFVGRLARQKAVHRLIEAFAHMAPGLPQARLVVVGDGPDLPALEHLAAARGVAGQVRLTGALPGQRMMAGFDMFALSSLYEAFPYVFLEAMLRELPVVATRVGGADELLHQEENALLVEQGDVAALADAMAALVADPERRRAMGARSAQIVKEFGTDAMVRNTERVYATLLERRAVTGN